MICISLLLILFLDRRFSLVRLGEGCWVIGVLGVRWKWEDEKLGLHSLYILFFSLHIVSIVAIWRSVDLIVPIETREHSFVLISLSHDTQFVKQ